MFAGIGKPLFSSDDMSDFHLPIINNVGEVESGPAVFFDDDEIIEFDKVDSAVIFVNKVRGSFEQVASDSDSEWLTSQYALLHLWQCESRTSSIITPSLSLKLLVLLIIILTLGRFLLSFLLNLTVRLCLLLMLTEARIG